MNPRLALAIVGTVFGLSASAQAAVTDATAARRGANWLSGQQITSVGQQADTIVALAAVGTAKSTLRSRLSTLTPAAPAYASGPGSAGKVVLAAVAAGVNPRTLGGVNYIARIRGAYRNGWYGTSTYDQAYAILALRAAGESVPIMAIRRVTGARGRGGWGYKLSTGVRDDASATGIMVQALRAYGLTPRHSGLAAATTWMTSRRNSAGGYAIDGGNRPTEANTTAIVIAAMRSMRRTPSRTTINRLRRLQEGDGGFRFTLAARGSRVMASVDAVVALAGKSLPIR
jgi:hypothetical protein